MPAVIDHDARRAALAEIAADLVARGGAEAATVRAVAAAAGFSTKAVTHYFPDKRALMLLTYRHAALSSQARTDASQPAGGGGDIRALLLALLPIDPKVERDWRVWFSFWGIAIADPEFAAEQRGRMRDFVDQIAAILAADPACGHLAEEQRPAIASALLAALFGTVTQAIFDPETWPAARQSEAIDEALTRIAGLVSKKRRDEG